VTQRTNEEWLSALRGPQRDEALADLRRILLRGLRVALSSKGRLSDDDLDDFVQDALLRILDALDSFRGEARFTTWAYKIAIRVALSELRRRRWRDVSFDDLAPGSDGLFVPQTIVDPEVTPEQQAIQQEVLRTLRRAIANDLTEKQRQALVAARVHGMPLDEIARRMDTNRNALYKLLFDARQRLQKSLLARGLPPDDILSAFGLPSEVRASQGNTSMKAERSK
jgi:RNA polymerase sigma-70 factor (ECF subfamily)